MNPMWEVEQACFERGIALVCGADEAGAGPLAGRVYAAAVILPEGWDAPHLNDSKNPFASHKDRHECIGKGSLGLETFRAVVNHPALQGLPMILETPNELAGYKAEIEILRKL